MYLVTTVVQQSVILPLPPFRSPKKRGEALALLYQWLIIKKQTKVEPTMTTGQTMLTIFAFVLLTTTLNNFYRLLGASGDDISTGQDGILATSIATSYIEIAQGMAYDEVTDTSDIALGSVTALTPALNLGPEGTEDSLHEFNDFDDFDGFILEKEASGTGRLYATQFSVNYVNALDVAAISNARTYVKRMDLKTWRLLPPAPRADTLRLSFVLGYFHFD